MTLRDAQVNSNFVMHRSEICRDFRQRGGLAAAVYAVRVLEKSLMLIYRHLVTYESLCST